MKKTKTIQNIQELSKLLQGTQLIILILSLALGAVILHGLYAQRATLKEMAIKEDKNSILIRGELDIVEAFRVTVKKHKKWDQVIYSMTMDDGTIFSLMETERIEGKLDDGDEVVIVIIKEDLE